MPTYQYRCLHCRKRFEIFMTFTEYGTSPVVCPHCESDQVQRRIGRIRVARSEESRMESMADPGSLEGLEDDPQALGRMMRKMSGEMGEEMGPEFNEVIDRLESGQSPDDIEKALPELGSEDGGGMGDMGGMGGMGGLDDFD
jgi:putative FmdB family regulatory protein